MNFLFLSLIEFLLAQDGVSLPEEFDLRKKYPQCPSISSPLNQGSCGSCWAFSTTSTAADRLCINDYTTEFMSPEHPVQCDSGQEACNGGYIRTAFDFQIQSGLVPLVCKAYRDTQVRRCAETCDDTMPITSSMLLKPKGKRRLDNKDFIKSELFTFGSVTASYKVFEEFYDYFNGDPKRVYKLSNNPGTFETYHAVKVVGWTKDGWLIQNSWGRGWADGGYFRIGWEEAEITKDVYAPLFDPFVDDCARLNGYACHECKDTTKENPDSGKENITTHCKFCITTDKCIQINQKGAAARGICQKFADNDSQCPVDDCVQMSADPLRCLSHSGCGYCVSTKKCRKGSERPNTGECRIWYNNLGEFATNYNATRVTNSSLCQDRNELFCEGINKCLTKIAGVNDTQVGRCLGQATNYSGVQGGIMIKPEECKNFTDLASCIKNNSCYWNRFLKVCQSSETEGTKDPLDDSKCLRYSCKTCKMNSDCVWCSTTQSCIAAVHGEDENKNPTVATVETNCTLPVLGAEDPCSECIKYSTCVQCALDTKCGWWNVSSYCTEGRLQAKTDKKDEEKDQFLSYKMQCEIRSVDQLEPYKMDEIKYNSGGVVGAASAVHAPTAAVFFATVLSLVVVLMVAM